MTESLAEDDIYVMRLMDRRQRRRRQGIHDRPEESMTTTEASKRKMSTNTTTTTTYVSAEDIQCVQGIEDDEVGGSGLMTGLVDW